MISPNFRLDNQAALVTGSASGIGREIAVGLAEAGADVACVDLPGPGLDEVVGEIQRRERRALALPCDVTEAADLAAAVRRTEAELGPLTLAHLLALSLVVVGIMMMVSGRRRLRPKVRTR